MKTYVVIFCIVASVFAIAALTYVAGSIVYGVSKRREERRVGRRAYRSSLRTEGVLLVTGLLCAASGLLLGCAIAKDKDRRSEPSAKHRFFKR